MGKSHEELVKGIMKFKEEEEGEEKRVPEFRPPNFEDDRKVVGFIEGVQNYLAGDVKEDWDIIHRPPHYLVFPKEVLEIIRFVLGPEGFKTYCIGNELKYRLRAGFKKTNAEEDLQKALEYYRLRNEEF